MTNGSSLKEIRVGIGWTVAVAIISGAAGLGGAYVGLKGEIALLKTEQVQLRSDLALRDTFQAELRTVRDSIESKAHQESAYNDRSHEIDLQSIKLAMRGAGIHVEN